MSQATYCPLIRQSTVQQCPSNNSQLLCHRSNRSTLCTREGQPTCKSIKPCSNSRHEAVSNLYHQPHRIQCKLACTRRNTLFHDTRLNNCNLLTCFVVDKLRCAIRLSLAAHLLYMHKSFCTPASAYAVSAYIQASNQHGTRIVSRYSSQQLQPPYMFRAWLS